MLIPRTFCWICFLLLIQTPFCLAVERDTSRVWDTERFRGQVADFLLSKTNDLWIVQDTRITRFSQNDGYTHYSNRESLFGGQIDFVIEDNEGVIWCFGELDNQTVVSTFDGQKWMPITNLPEPLKNQPDIGFGILFDQKNHLWIGTGDLELGAFKDPTRGGLGLFYFNGQTWTQYTYQNGLAHNAVMDIEESSDGSIWVATLGGINRFKNQTWMTYTKEHGLLTNEILDIHIMPNNEIWATYTSSLSVFDTQTNTWHPAKDTDMPLGEIGSLLCQTNNEVWFNAIEGPDPIRYASNSWMRLPPEIGFPEDIDAMVQNNSGDYWILHDATLTYLQPNYPDRLTIQGNVSHKKDGSPWPHAAVRLDDQDDYLQAWTKADANGHYQLQVFITPHDSTQESYMHRIWVVNGEKQKNIDLSNKTAQSIILYHLFDNKKTSHFNTHLTTTFIVLFIFITIWFLKNKWAPNLINKHLPLIYLSTLLAFIALHIFNLPKLEIDALIDTPSILWGIALSFVIKFVITNQILPRFLLVTNDAHSRYNYHNAKSQSWALVPIFPAIFCFVMLIRYTDDPSLIGPFAAGALIGLLYSMMGYVLNLSHECQALLQSNREMHWMDGHFRFVVILGCTVLFVISSNTLGLLYVFGSSETALNNLTNFAQDLLFSGIPYLITPYAFSTIFLWLALSALIAQLILTPTHLSAIHQRTIFFRNLTLTSAISAYTFSVVSFLNILANLDTPDQLWRESVFFIYFPVLSLIVSCVLEWHVRQTGQLKQSTLTPTQFRGNKWASVAMFILCIWGFLAGIFNVFPEAGEGIVVSLIGFSFLTWINRRRVHLENLIAQRTAELEAEKARVELENERKTQELEEARQLQLSMLPQANLDHPDVVIAFDMKPATEVGGDYFDFTLTQDRTLTIALGDATGHGLRAGILVTATKSLFHALSHNTDILQIFAAISQTLKVMNLQRMNMALTLIKITNRKLQISAAGMPPMLLYRAETKQVEEILLEGLPLGITTHFEYDQYECHLSPGDTLLIMSDGLPERQNLEGDLFGYDRVQTNFAQIANQTPQDICAQMWHVGEKWSQGHPQDDDITLVAFKIK